MIYAKCIKESQIAKTKEEFISRQNEEYHVYCVGETTVSKYGMDNLYCVPLNFIYDCLRYGEYIAFIDIADCNEKDYIRNSSYKNVQLAHKEQKVLKIINAYSIEAIDFLFKEVKDPTLIYYGYLHWLPNDMQDYFKSLLNKKNI